METKVNSAGEEQPVDEKSRYAKMSTAELKEQLTIKLPDEQLPKSLSAKWANYEIELASGEKVKFLEGSKLHHKEVFAGKGTKTPIREVNALVKKYGGKREEWQKVKAFGTIVHKDGKTEEIEVHWYEEPSVGRVKLKEKVR